MQDRNAIESIVILLPISYWRWSSLAQTAIVTFGARQSSSEWIENAFQADVSHIESIRLSIDTRVLFVANIGAWHRHSNTMIAVATNWRPLPRVPALASQACLALHSGASPVFWVQTPAIDPAITSIQRSRPRHIVKGSDLRRAVSLHCPTRVESPIGGASVARSHLSMVELLHYNLPWPSIANACAFTPPPSLHPYKNRTEYTAVSHCWFARATDQNTRVLISSTCLSSPYFPKRSNDVIHFVRSSLLTLTDKLRIWARNYLRHQHTISLHFEESKASLTSNLITINTTFACAPSSDKHLTDCNSIHVCLYTTVQFNVIVLVLSPIVC